MLLWLWSLWLLLVWTAPDHPPQDRPSAEPPKISLFFPLSRPPFCSFSVSLGVFSLNFGGVFEGRDPEMCTFGVLGLSCKIVAGEGKKREIVGSPPFGARRVFVLPCFIFILLFLFFFEKEGQTKTPILAKVGLAKVGQLRLAKVGQIRMAKVGVAKVGVAKVGISQTNACGLKTKTRSRAVRLIKRRFCFSRVEKRMFPTV